MSGASAWFQSFFSSIATMFSALVFLTGGNADKISFPEQEMMMVTAAVPAPQRFEQLGIGRTLLEELALKTIYQVGETSTQELAEHMKISRTLVDELWQRLRKDQLCEVAGMIGPVYRVQVTSAGRARALDLLRLNQYTGPVPIPLDDYARQVRWQSIRRGEVRPEDMERAFQQLVVDRTVLTQLGTAMTSGRAIFLYGPTGTGKTILAETLATVLHRDLVWLPYAVEVDGQIITVFDPHLHQTTSEALPPGSDPRWALCHRPKVVVGGELTIEMLDLQYNQMTKFYTAPIQMKANNGVLIIDDFGRQRVRPDELLNRWVVPLDRSIDFLSLVGGKKMEIPFDMFVVFATNLAVNQLDDAFLRRIQTKIKVDFVTPEQFEQIFANMCHQLQVPYDPLAAEELVQIITVQLQQPLRACYPRDILNQVCWTAKYEGRQARLDRESLEQACRNYFVAGGDS